MVVANPFFRLSMMGRRDAATMTLLGKKRFLTFSVIVVLCLSLIHYYRSLRVETFGSQFVSRGKIETVNKEKMVKHVLPPLLTTKAVDSVKVFVFFIGYARSGHSVIGGIMDAHPHIIIADEFMLFKKWSIFDESKSVENWSSHLFNELYQSSYKGIISGNRSPSRLRKGYTLHISSSWQGKYDEYVEVIGDKSGGMTTDQYRLHPQQFIRHYRMLKDKLKIPIKVIHVLRNPFDIITTYSLYKAGGKYHKIYHNMTSPQFLKQIKMRYNSTNSDFVERAIEIVNPLLEVYTNLTLQRLQAATELIEVIGKGNVLEVHSYDLVYDPHETIKKVCNFVGVSAPDDYLQMCANKIYKSYSRTRDLVVWPTELINMVENRMKHYKMLNRYSFTDD